MYEILGVSSSASPAELKAAHRRRSFEVMSGKLGLGPEDCKFQLQLLDVALNTLSDPVSRDAYDMQQAAANQVDVSLPAQLATGSVGAEGNALQLVTAAEIILKSSMATVDDRQLQIKAISQSFSASMRSLKTILRIVLLLLVLGMVMRMGGCMLAARKPVLPLAAMAKAEDKLIVQAYYKKHGVRAANRAEVAALEAGNRARENETREEEFKQRRAEDEAQRFIEDSKNNYRRQEMEQERAEAEARYQATRRKEREEAEALRRARVSQARYGANDE